MKYYFCCAQQINDGGLSKGHRSQLERALAGQFWDKILIVMDYNLE